MFFHNLAAIIVTEDKDDFYDWTIEGQNHLIMGVANKWSIAWDCTVLRPEGARRIFHIKTSDQNAVEQLSAALPEVALYPCDVTSDEEIKELFYSIRKDYGIIHG